MEKIYKDYNTTNKSFLKVANQLKEAGVKNYDFMLALYDKSLAGVELDIGRDAIDKKLQEKIDAECKKNIWYYFREVVRIAELGGYLMKFPLTKLTAAMIFLATAQKNQYVIGHRMSFKSHTVECIRTYFLMYGYATNVFHVNDAEYNTKVSNDLSLSYSLIKKEEQLNDVENASENCRKTIQIYESTISDKDKNQHMDLLKNTTPWNDSCYDLPVDKLADFYYVYYDYKELVDDPESFLKSMSTYLCHDEDAIRREILCERKYNPSIFDVGSVRLGYLPEWIYPSLVLLSNQDKEKTKRIMKTIRNLSSWEVDGKIQYSIDEKDMLLHMFVGDDKIYEKLRILFKYILTGEVDMYTGRKTFHGLVNSKPYLDFDTGKYIFENHSTLYSDYVNGKMKLLICNIIHSSKDCENNKFTFKITDIKDKN